MEQVLPDVPQLVKKCSNVTAPEGSLACSLQPTACPSPEPLIKSTLSHPIPLRSILIVSFHPSDLLPSTFPTKTWYAPMLFRIHATCHMPSSSHPSSFSHTNIIFWEVQIMKLLIMQSSTTPCPSLHPSYPQISPSAPYFVTPPGYGLPSVPNTKVTVCATQPARSQSRIVWSLYLTISRNCFHEQH